MISHKSKHTENVACSLILIPSHTFNDVTINVSLITFYYKNNFKPVFAVHSGIPEFAVK